MFLALHQRLHDREEGFTLIELLVVVIIIGILAAVAIPTFLRQRERGWEAAAQSTLRNAAVAQESFATGNDGNYTMNGAAELEAEGFNPSADTPLTMISIVNGTADEYCMSSTHVGGGDTWFLGSETGEPSTTACT